MNTLSFEMMSAGHNDLCANDFYKIIEFTESVKELIVCHFIKLNELIKRINIFKKQSEYDWLQSNQKIAMNAEFYSYLRKNTKLLDSDLKNLSLNFMEYKESLEQFRIQAYNQEDLIEKLYFKYQQNLTLDDLLNGHSVQISTLKHNPIYDEFRKLEQGKTELSLDILESTYKHNFELLTSVKESQEGVFLQADTIIKDMRKQF